MAWPEVPAVFFYPFPGRFRSISTLSAGPDDLSNDTSNQIRRINGWTDLLHG
jgi:hypothetical protein